MTATDPDAHTAVGPEAADAVREVLARVRVDGPGPLGRLPPRAGIDVRHVDAAHGVIITVTGALENADAGAVGQCLETEFDRRPTVVVVDLSGVPSCASGAVEVLLGARNRARRDGIAMHLVHLGAPAVRAWLTAAGLA